MALDAVLDAEPRHADICKDTRRSVADGQAIAPEAKKVRTFASAIKEEHVQARRLGNLLGPLEDTAAGDVQLRVSHYAHRNNCNPKTQFSL